MNSQTPINKGPRKAQRISSPMRKRLYTVKDAGFYLGRSEYSVRTLIWDGLLPVIKNPNGEQNGKKMWLDIKDMDLFVERNKETVL
jgi:hypothetical protein